MKNVCFIISDISTCGGTEQVCLKVAGGLCERGYNVKIFTYNRELNPYFDYNKSIKIIPFFSNAIERKGKYKKWFKILKLRYLLIKHRIDVVIDVDLFLSYFTVPALKGLNIKHISWENYCYEHSQGAQYLESIKYLEANNSSLVTLTKRDRDLYISNTSLKDDKVFCIYNPLTFEPQSVQVKNNKKVISVGRFSEEKGFDRLLDIWKQVECDFPQWTLDIWGDDGMDVIGLHSYRKSLGLKNVNLYGQTNDVKGKMNAAAIYVMTSRHEGLGLVLLEACASGLPIVVYDCPNGPREVVVDGENGFLVKDGDVNGFKMRLTQLMKSSELRTEMGAKALLSSYRFTLKTIISQWVDLIE